MSNQMKPTDSIRVNILRALLEKGSVQPNIRQIQKQTGYHKATIKSSLAFLEKEGILHGFGPKIDFRKLGYNLEILSLFQADLSESKAFEKFLEALEGDSHIFWVSSLIGSGNWNILCRQIHKDVESYHHELQNRYMSIKGYHDVIKDVQSFFSVEPIFKNESRTKSIVDLIKSSNQKK